MFRLLIDGSEVSVGRAQIREVLACLTASGSEITTRSELIDALWGDSPPQDPRAALRVILTRTRDVLGAANDALISDGDVIRITAESDVSEFMRLAAKDAAAPGDLRKALDLWRGDAYEGLGNSRWMQRARRRLEQQRESVSLRLATTLSQDQHFEESLTVAQPLFERLPEREDLACLVASTLARLGRKTDSLNALDKTRTLLRDRGLEPSPEFVRLEGSILVGAVDLDRKPVEDEIEGEFVGRDEHVRNIVKRPPLSTTIVIGEAGIGKTSLLRLVEKSLHAADCDPIRVRAPLSAVRPIETAGLIAEALLKRGAVPTHLHESALAMLVPGSVATSPSRPTTRALLVEAVVDFISTNTNTNTAIIIDDAHLMEAGSAAVVAELVAEPPCRILLAQRPTRHTSIWEENIARDDVVELGPLSLDAAEVLVGRDLPGSTEGSRREIFRRSGGNPLFLRFLIDLTANGVEHDKSLPPAVLATIQQRLWSLSEEGRRFLRISSVFGQTAQLRHLAELIPDAEQGLREAEKERLVTLESDTVSFVHALVAEGAYQLLGEGERVLLHDEIGRLLEAAGEPPIVYWPHFREAELLDISRAIQSASGAAEELLAALDWESAIECAEWAIAKSERSYPDDPPPYAALVSLAQAQFALGIAGSQHQLIEGARLAADAGDSERFGSAVIELCNSGSAALTGLDVHLVVELIRDALERPLSEETRIRLLAAAPRALVYSKEGRYGHDLYAKALDAYDSCDRVTQELILRNSEAGLSHPADFQRLQQATARMAEEAGRNPELQWMALWFQFRDALITGDGLGLTVALEQIRSSSTDSERRHSFVALGQSYDVQMQQAWAESAYAHVHGDHEKAEAEANRALEVGLERVNARGDDFGAGWVTSSYGALIVAIRHDQGRLAELVDFVEVEAADVPAWKVAIIMSNFAAGNNARAVSEIESLTSNNFSQLVPDPAWTAAMRLISEPIAALMEKPLIESTYELILPFADRMSFSGICTLGPMATGLATLADALGRTSDANDHRAVATELWSTTRLT